MNRIGESMFLIAVSVWPFLVFLGCVFIKSKISTVFFTLASVCVGGAAGALAVGLFRLLWHT